MRANSGKSSAQAPVPYSWRLSVGLIHKDSLPKPTQNTSPRLRGLGDWWKAYCALVRPVNFRKLPV